MYIIYNNEILKNVLILENIYKIESQEIFNVDNREDKMLYNDIKYEIQNRLYDLLEKTDIINLLDKRIDIDYLVPAINTLYNVDLEATTDVVKMQLNSPEFDKELVKKESVKYVMILQLAYMGLPFNEQSYINLITNTDEAIIEELNELIGFPKTPLKWNEFKKLVKEELIKEPTFIYMLKHYYDQLDDYNETVLDVIKEYKNMDKLYENKELIEFISSELKLRKADFKKKEPMEIANSITDKVISKFKFENEDIEEEILDLVLEIMEDNSDTTIKEEPKQEKQNLTDKELIERIEEMLNGDILDDEDPEHI